MNIPTLHPCVLANGQIFWGQFFCFLGCSFVCLLVFLLVSIQFETDLIFKYLKLFSIYISDILSFFIYFSC